MERTGLIQLLKRAKAFDPKTKDQLQKLLRPAIRILPRQDKATGKTTRSRLGGLPDLLKDSDWPRWKGRRLGFIGQFDLAEVAPYDEAGLLPKTGLLSFFFGSEEFNLGFEASDKGGGQVVYSAPRGTKGQTRKWPTALPDKYRFGPFNLHFSEELTLPALNSLHMRKLALTSEQRSSYLNLEAAVEDRELRFGPVHRLLGHARHVGIEAFEELCQVCSNGFDWGDGRVRDNPRLTPYLRDASEWRMLLQVESDQPGMLWDDLGILSFWIRSDDLKNRNFSNTWTVRIS